MIERQTIDGRLATVAYLTADFEPANADAFDFAKVIFDDGEMVILQGPGAPAEPLTIDILQQELDGNLPHWLAKPSIGDRMAAIRATVRAKHRAAHFAKPAPIRPVRRVTLIRARAAYEEAKAQDPFFHPESVAFRRHRHRTFLPPVADIEGQAEAEAWGKRRHRQSIPIILPGDPNAPAMDLGDDPAAPPRKEIPVERQLAIWAKAIRVLDLSEVELRDVIERDLSGTTGDFAAYRPMKAINTVASLTERVRLIRVEAFKTAFRGLRAALGDRLVLDISLARWAAYFAAVDQQGIAAALQLGLADGLDNAEIAQRIVGTMALNGVDGVTEQTRLKIAHLGRAAIRESNLRKQGLNADGEAEVKTKGLDPGA